MTINPTQLVQIEIKVKDIAKALSFYEHAFGWTLVPAEMYPYHVIDVPKDCTYGIALVEQKDLDIKSNSVILYWQVDDLEAVKSKVIENGGNVLIDKMKIPPEGQMSQISDPDGNRWGLFTP